MKNIFLISSQENLTKTLKSILIPAGYKIVGESPGGISALRIIRALSLDLIILDTDLPDISGLELAKIISADKIAPILLLTSSCPAEMSSRVENTWIFAFTLKPITPANLLPSVQSALTAFSHLSQVEAKLHQLEESLKNRKIVEQAKGLLMNNLHLNEADAYNKLRQQSMNKGVPLVKIAEAVILLYKD